MVGVAEVVVVEVVATHADGCFEAPAAVVAQRSAIAHGEAAAEGGMADSGITGLSAMEEYLSGVDTLRPDSIVWTL